MPIQVVAAVVERKGRYLVCLRPQRKRHGGLWEFPGGKIDPGESAADAIRREIAEELAAEVSQVGRVLYSHTEHGSDYLILFIETELVGTPIPVEHDQLAWCQPEELPYLPLAPSDRAFVVERLIPTS